MIADSLVNTASTEVVSIDKGGDFEAGTKLLNLLAPGSSITFGATGQNIFTIEPDSGSLLNLLSGGTTIDNFSSIHDQIDDQTIVFSDVAKYTVADGVGGVQTVTFLNGSGISLGSLAFAPNTFGSLVGTFNIHGAGPIVASADANGFLDFVRCFLAGTHILTPAGEVLVEELAIGDEVVLADGSVKPVLWIGRNTVATRFADPLRFAPIRIGAGALGDYLPVRDLLVSPGHAMFVGGVLIHAGALVNGISITRETNLPETFVYYHIELDSHTLILAEGAATESFVDNVDRMAFDNWAEHEDLYSDSSIVEMDLPRAKSARQVPQAVRRRLLTVAASFADRSRAA